jgi:hypothetical protein
VLSVVIFFMVTVSAHAGSLRCPYKRPNINFTPTISPVEYVTTVPVSGLTQMHHGAHDHAGIAGKQWVGGLGGGKMGLEYKTVYRMATLGEEACLYIQEISGTFYAHPQVHVASNFKRGSCEYRAVLNHESKHIAVFKSAYHQNATKLRSIFRNMAMKYKVTGPIHVSELESAKLRIEREIEDRIRELNDKLMNDLAERQSRIDTPKEYDRVARKCRNWDKKVNATPPN